MCSESAMSQKQEPGHPSPLLCAFSLLCLTPSSILGYLAYKRMGIILKLGWSVSSASGSPCYLWSLSSSRCISESTEYSASLNSTKSILTKLPIQQVLCSLKKISVDTTLRISTLRAQNNT